MRIWLILILSTTWLGLMRVNLAYATDYSINTRRVLIAHYSWDLCPPVFNLSFELSIIDYFSGLTPLIIVTSQ